MTECQTQCAHEFAKFESVILDISQLSFLGKKAPIWNAQCACQSPRRAQSPLSSLIAKTARLIPAIAHTTKDARSVMADMAIYWTHELPRVMARFCHEHMDFQTAYMPSSETQKMAIAVFDTLKRRSKGEREQAILQGGEPCHLLLHLLDTALSNDLLEQKEVLSCLCLSAAVLSHGSNASAGGRIWQALVNFSGILVARYKLDNDMQGNAIEIARMAVDVLPTLPPETQTAIVALVHMLSTKYTDKALSLVTMAIGQCLHASSRIKQDLGQLAKQLAQSTVLPVSAAAIRDLAGDWDANVRAVWTQIASQPTIQTQSTALLSLPMPIADLCDSTQLLPINRQTADRCAMALTLDDAKFIVKLVSESIGCSGYGLAQKSIDTMGAFYQATGMGRLSDIGVHQACLTVMAGAARRIGSDHGPQSSLKPTISWLANAIRSYLAEQANAGNGLFWALEMLVQLCIQDAGAIELHNDAKLQLLLVDAAVKCSNLGAVVYMCQVAMAACESSSDGAVIRRLASAVDWPTISSMFGGDLGNVASLLASRCMEAAEESGAELEQLAASFTDGTGASERLRGFDSDLFKANITEPIDELRFERSLVCCTDADAAPQLRSLADTCHMADLILRPSGVFAAHGLVFGTYQPMRTQLSQISSIKWPEMTRHQQLKAIDLCYTYGLVSSRSVVAALQQMDTGGLSARDLQSWVNVATKASVSVAYDNERADISLVQQQALAIDHIRYSFAFKSTCDINQIGLGDRLHQAATERCCTRAKEALLYFSARNPDCSLEFISDLYAHVLNEASGRLRFTASGTFDAASQLIAQMSTAPTRAPRVHAESLSACAARQLAPFIPQLLAMLSFDPHGTASVSLASDSAFAIVKLLIQCAPDMVAFYVVVAQNSLADASSSKRQVTRLLQMLDDEQTAQIRTFVDCVGKVATLPQEQLRWACNKAKHAYAKLLAAYKLNQLTRDAAPAAIEDVLQPVYQLLERQYGRGRSSAENEYAAVVTTLQLTKRLDRLRFHAGFDSQGVRALERHAEAVWTEMAQLMATPSVLDVGYASTQLAEFTAAIPIPSLTQPATPLYFAGVDRKLRIIGSKTRPKLLTLHFHTDDNAMVSQKYIFKGSEDLRIDESVMQVFVRLNRVLSQDQRLPMASRLATYNVVPTGSYGGLIQMVNDAPSLFAIYMKHATGNGKQPPGLRQTFTDHAARELKRAKLPDSLPISEWPQQVAASVYESLCSTVPSNMVQRHVMRASPSAAHMLVGLQRLVRSIGMASAAGYLVGLGDRHLDNLLVTADEQLVHIDFNVCYDFGGVSQVPEQVPYRLTRTLEFLCGSPSQHAAYSSTFARSFSAVMRVARMDRQVLVDALTYRMMFWPFMEWRWIEQRREESHGLEEAVEAIRKTGLCPPGAFWSTSMQACSVTEASYGWRLADGAVRRTQARLEFAGSACPVQLQTKLLWDAATDKSKLSRMFAGWASWI